MRKRLLLGMVILTLLAGVLGSACGGKDKTNDDTANGTTTPALEVTEPQDESVVSTSEVTVKGVTTADAAVSVNGTLVNVDEDGKFSTVVSLEEGPNTIVVVASDSQDNEASKLLTVIYAKP